MSGGDDEDGGSGDWGGPVFGICCVGRAEWVFSGPARGKGGTESDQG